MKTKIALIFCLVVIILSGCGKSSGDTQTGQDEVNELNGPDSISDESEEVIVTFDCPELERLVRAELDKETGDILSTDMLQLYYVRANGDNVSSLSGLEYAKNLSDFGILRNDIDLDSLDPISNLTSLTRINLSYTNVANPVALGKLDKVTYFALIDTNISDISYLNEFTSLEHLTLTNNGISDIDALAGLKNLTQLNLRGNSISSLEALRGKGKIEFLNIQDNNVSDIEPLADLISLENLTLSYNPITNLKPLEDLPKLVELTIYQHHDVKHLIFDQIEILVSKGIDVSYHK
ncbi:MAG: leucine-rich repeat domain-containing protein [Firmicutes bacterium]|nr:leucine-rich repeat domain-containing protein [Bacillota bacterium]